MRILEWADEARSEPLPCQTRNPEDYFPEKHRRILSGANFDARSACGGCPVVEKCLKFAIENYAVGIWGGTTSYERAQLRTLQAIRKRERDFEKANWSN
jgi:WhiB family redox-sensing transcriptional regulator